MKFESRKVTFNKKQEELYNYLTYIENYEILMPEDTIFTLLENQEGFNFQLKGMPRVGLKVQEKKPYEYIRFESPNDSFTYEMKIVIEKLQDTASSVQVLFDGKFNAMLEMMVKRPLTNFLETLVNHIESKIL